MSTLNIHRIHQRLRSIRQHRQTTLNPPIPETYPAPERVDKVEADKPLSVYLVGKRPPLAKYPAIWRFLARWIYKQLNWCPDYGIEYQGVYTDEAEARYNASAQGAFYMELPLNASLPDETAQFGVHDFPLSEASAEYRRRRFAYVSIPRVQLEALSQKVERNAAAAEGQYVKA